MVTPTPAQEHEIETALVCGAARCAWGGADKADLKLLAVAVKAAGDHLVGTPAYRLAMEGSGFLSGAERCGAEELGAALLVYCHERMPPAEPEPAPAAEAPPDDPPAEPTPEPARNWAREHDLMG